MSNTRPGALLKETIDPGGAPPRLVVLKGQEPGRRYDLTNPAFVIGRAEGCDIPIDETKVSRHHARIQLLEGRWMIEDLASRNGTMVNGEALQGPTSLNVGDRIQLPGDTLLLFSRRDPLEDLIIHRQQMEVIGHLAAGIAHDFNNLLSVISASCAHLSRLDPATPLSDDQVGECHADIFAAARRSAELTARLLTIARRREDDEAPDPMGVVNITTLCQDVLQLVRRTFDRRIEVVGEIDPRALPVLGVQAGLHQLIMNLCLNARDAMTEHGVLTVRAFMDEGDSERAPQVVVEVTDTGPGMTRETRARVFEPFFSTKEHGSGGGLGLATALEVATHHGGVLEVDSETGRGSTFRLRLPYHIPPASKKQPLAMLRQMHTEEARRGGRGTGHVMVVDDQELVRRSIGRLMEAAGHEVTYAVDGRDAFEKYADPETRPEVVLMDFDMPYFTGEETLQKIREINPEAMVILMSGYCDEAQEQRLRSRGASDFLAKPVDAASLLASVEVAFRLSTGRGAKKEDR